MEAIAPSSALSNESRIDFNSPCRLPSFFSQLAQVELADDVVDLAEDVFDFLFHRAEIETFDCVLDLLDGFGEFFLDVSEVDYFDLREIVELRFIRFAMPSTVALA